MPQARFFWLVLAVVLAAHAALLSLAGLRTESAPHGQAGGLPVTLQVRTLLPPMRPAREDTTTLPGAQPAIAAAPTPAVAMQAPQEASPAAAAPAAPPAAGPPGLPPAVRLPTDPWAGYRPRGELTEAPRPLHGIDVPFPEVRGIVDLKVRVTLFIDADGAVRRVRLDTPDVEPAFAQAIVGTFEQARFSPGRRGAEAVPSQIRLEVEFDAGAPRRS